MNDRMAIIGMLATGVKVKNAVQGAEKQLSEKLYNAWKADPKDAGTPEAYHHCNAVAFDLVRDIKNAMINAVADDWGDRLQNRQGGLSKEDILSKLISLFHDTSNPRDVTQITNVILKLLDEVGQKNDVVPAIFDVREIVKKIEMANSGRALLEDLSEPSFEAIEDKIVKIEPQVEEEEEIID